MHKHTHNTHTHTHAYTCAQMHDCTQGKTVAAHAESLKVAEKKALAQVQKVRAQPLAQTQRKMLWFERFNWFISRWVGLLLLAQAAAISSLGCSSPTWLGKISFTFGWVRTAGVRGVGMLCCPRECGELAMLEVLVVRCDCRPT